MSETKDEMIGFIPVDEIDKTGTLLQEVSFKPRWATTICMIVGVLLLITMRPLAMVLGVFFLVISVFVSVKIKDYKTMDIYDSFILIYSSNDVSLARKIDYSEIVEWTCKVGEGMSDALMLKLANGEILYKDTFQTSRVMKSLNTVIHAKEKRAIQEAKNKQTKLKFVNPFKKKIK